MEAEARKRAEEEERITCVEADARRQAEEEEKLRKEAQAKKQANEEHAKRRQEEAETQRRLAEEAERRRQEREVKKRAEVERRKPYELPPAAVGARRQRESDLAQPADASEQEAQGQSSRPWRPSRRGWVIAGVLIAGATAGAAAWWREETHPPATATAPVPAAEKEAVTPLMAAQERALKAGDSFKECSDCPEMIVVPAGNFMMGSPAGQGEKRERPEHKVTIAKPFAAAKFALTFDEWDTCAARGGCRRDVSDQRWGRGRRPAINVSWDDAQAYVKWLSDSAGKEYRLLSEAEYEYGARAGSHTAYPWGDEIQLYRKAMANCYDCGNARDGEQTVPVGSFAANAFGLYDMVGNAWAWAEDCWNENYEGSPTDGSPSTSGDCSRRVVRGGSWSNHPYGLRSANRGWIHFPDRSYDLGFRAARTLNP